MGDRSVTGSKIAALGDYRPKDVISNATIAERLGVSPEWIESRTGIIERRRAAAGETVADMATAAAQCALLDLAERAPQSQKSQVDTVIVATSTAEVTIPSVAAQVAANLRLGQPAAFDLNTACAGFCYALATADALIRAGTSKGVLVIGADKSTDWVDWDDRDTAILFGDGAGAAIVFPNVERAIGPVLWGSIGDQSHIIGIAPGDLVLRQDGRAVYRWAVGLGSMAREVCDLSGIDPRKLRAFIPHQANLRIIDALAKSLDLDSTAVARDVTETGNTIAATIPIALSRMVQKGEVGSGDDVLLFGFGAGLAYAGLVVTL
jgi:3-oxoacyl-[acyl-carrier-protein] synthase III